MNTFQNLLKAKSLAVQSQRQSIPAPIATIPMPPKLNTANGIIKAIQSGQVQTTPKPDDKLIVTINVELSRNRIDIFFNRIPDEGIRSELKKQGFWFSSTANNWYHKDTPKNREFLVKQFNAEFPIDESNEPDEIEITSVDSVTLTSVNKPISYKSETSSNFDRYKEQVNKLSEHYQVDPADLMVLAMDALYTRTFNYN